MQDLLNLESKAKAQAQEFIHHTLIKETTMTQDIGFFFFALVVTRLIYISKSPHSRVFSKLTSMVAFRMMVVEEAQLLLSRALILLLLLRRMIDQGFFCNSILG